MQTTNTTYTPFTFESFFQAESHLEKQGYHCEKEQWVHADKPIVSVVPTDNGVQIKPIQH
ncbi:hypothetical protein [Vibrio europaeus]|uniref:Uncharacterized protein n=1 Tax=Vibrio europaeus TaxID=300876 RepID=A0ABT5GMV5_9VIBR|nr:hypothetical protein [Vibrio europaeus]MDC5723117.1 hypothetical protein [Vibrio europaeus]MDC5728074.1 hypothetical protein [Vibrio europaeus]MDC5733377.1 hypothetical protein [Vibrio europaeus]MDC5738584.1 hypothetical protein [Vibrio europaeus]MDC5743854.1 hypothetical protein [Vibrio europaeus]